jgi:hypothetical protein
MSAENGKEREVAEAMTTRVGLMKILRQLRDYLKTK